MKIAVVILVIICIAVWYIEAVTGPTGISAIWISGEKLFFCWLALWRGALCFILMGWLAKPDVLHHYKHFLAIELNFFCNGNYSTWTLYLSFNIYLWLRTKLCSFFAYICNQSDWNKSKSKSRNPPLIALGSLVGSVFENEPVYLLASSPLPHRPLA